jgi:hypothetical protein
MMLELGPVWGQNAKPLICFSHTPPMILNCALPRQRVKRHRKHSKWLARSDAATSMFEHKGTERGRADREVVHK